MCEEHAVDVYGINSRVEKLKARLVQERCNLLQRINNAQVDAEDVGLAGLFIDCAMEIREGKGEAGITKPPPRAAEREGAMKNVVPVVICVLLLIGGSMLIAPAASTISVPATYAVVAPAPPSPQGDVDPPQPPVIERGIEVKKIPSGLLIPPALPVIPPNDDQLLAIAGPCAGGVCPLIPKVAVAAVKAPVTKAVSVVEVVARRPLRAVAQAGCAVGRVVKTVAGCERRQARRQARRGG